MYEVVSQLGSMRRQMVEHIGFGGFVSFPNIDDMGDQLASWLLSKLDVSSCELVVDGLPWIHISPSVVADVFGVPASGSSNVRECASRSTRRVR